MRFHRREFAALGEPLRGVRVRREKKEAAVSESVSETLVALTRELLDCIAQGNWERYEQICDSTLSAFEPEGRGHLIEGLGFHQFYFELGGHMGAHNSTLATPHVRLLGADAAVVSYVRLVQSVDASGQPQTAAFEETRVWERRDGQWRHVHFHRSPAP